MTHNSDVFYNKVTHDIVNYNDLKALYPISWPSLYTAPGVDDRIADTDPPNIFLGSHPTLGNWERLYRDPQPDFPEVAMWQIAEMDPVAFNGVTGRYEQTWTVRARDAGEMANVYIQVAGHAESLRQGKQVGAVLSYTNEDDVTFYMDATGETVTAISNLIEYLGNEGTDDTVMWKGVNDPVTQLPRWAPAKIGDLQFMSTVVEGERQKGFTVENATTAAHMDEPENFDSLDDITDFFNFTYDNY